MFVCSWDRKLIQILNKACRTHNVNWRARKTVIQSQHFQNILRVRSRWLLLNVHGIISRRWGWGIYAMLRDELMLFIIIVLCPLQNLSQAESHLDLLESRNPTHSMQHCTISPICHTDHKHPCALSYWPEPAYTILNHQMTAPSPKYTLSCFLWDCHTHATLNIDGDRTWKCTCTDVSIFGYYFCNFYKIIAT